MPVYYRADTRSPEEIFKDGFSNRITENTDDWWRLAIHAEKYKDDKGIDNYTVDADTRAAVCLTTNFESAAIFPIGNKEELYIYAISLPEAIQVEYYEKECNIYFMPPIVEDTDYERLEADQYKNSYVFTGDDQYYYIDFNGNLHRPDLTDDEKEKIKTMLTTNPDITPNVDIPLQENVTNMIWDVLPESYRKKITVRLINETVEKVHTERDERTINFLQTLPSENETLKYRNQYIFIPNHNDKLFNLIYIDNQGTSKQLEYSGSKEDYDNFIDFVGSKNKVLNENQLNRLWNIIACNEGHTQKNYALIKKSIAPTDIKNAVIDLHSLQTTQAGNIQASYKDLENQDQLSRAAELAAWPLYAYEAIAYKVPAENIIGAVKIATHPEEMEQQIISIQDVDPSKKHYETRYKKFDVVGEFQLNNKFNPDQHLSFGDNPAHEVKIDFTQEAKDAAKKIKEVGGKILTTPDIYFGLGGKTFAQAPSVINPDTSSSFINDASYSPIENSSVEQKDEIKHPKPIVKQDASVVSDSNSTPSKQSPSKVINNSNIKPSSWWSALFKACSNDSAMTDEPVVSKKNLPKQNNK